MRVVFFGTPDFAIPTLEALLVSRHQVAGVVTQPDRPQGRGRRLQPPPVKTLALARGVPVAQPERLKDQAFLDTMAGWRADLGVVAAYGRILPASLLEVPRLGLINVHASLLPRWRGASPVQHAVMAGDAETGVTIMRVVPALDAGAMLATVRRRIGRDETAGGVEADLSLLGAALLVEVVDALEQGPIPEAAQDETAVTYAPRLTREDGRLDWTLPAGVLHDRVRGLQPWPGAFTFRETQRLAVLEARLADPPTAAPRADQLSEVAQGGPGETSRPGTMAVDGRRLLVACGDATWLELVRVKPEGRPAMRADAYLAGHPPAPGVRFEREPPA
jgi:methionyl-tRNA formyltransferase